MSNDHDDAREEFDFESEMEALAESFQAALEAKQSPPASVPTPTVEEAAKQDKENHVQWALGGNGRYMPVGATVPKLPAGIYEPFSIPGMWGIELLAVASDGIYKLPDMATEVVLKEVDKFWVSEHKYKAHNLLYKRGLLLYGPPGGGKTIAVKLMMNELVKQDGIVVICTHVNLTVMVLKAIRRIEPTRNLIVVMEDIDEIISNNGEGLVLSMLDGENNISNVLHVATTNYIERLGARISNRPSRFDRRIYVGMPGVSARKEYLTQATKAGLEAKQLKQWVDDTDGMSIAHLRELVAAVYCLEQPYGEVVARLQDMAKAVKSDDEFKARSLGFYASKRNNRGNALEAAGG